MCTLTPRTRTDHPGRVSSILRTMEVRSVYICGHEILVTLARMYIRQTDPCKSGTRGASKQVLLVWDVIRGDIRKVLRLDIRRQGQ